MGLESNEALVDLLKDC